MLSVYTVTTLADPGSGGALSLRQAIAAANTAGGTNEIDFAGGLTGTIDLAGVLPTISCGLTINGPGASLLTVNGHGFGSVLTFAPGSNGTPSSIDGLTITGGIGSGSGTLGGGDGGGGIDNSGDTLTVSNCVITGNSSTGVGGGISSGAMGDVGSLYVTNSTISGNTASSSGGGVYAAYGTGITIAGSVISGNTSGSYGGGIDSPSHTNVSESTISNNSAVYGGGIYGGNIGSQIVTHSTISGNVATGSSTSVGGGIDLAGPGTVTNSTISGNSATEAGGGVYSEGAFYIGTLTLIDSTVSGNSAGAGGGLYDSAGGTSTSVVNSTLTGNTATTTTGGGIDNESGTLTITDSTISGNSAATSGGGVYSYHTASDAGTINGTVVAANAGGDLKPKAGFFSGSNDLIGDGSDQGALSNTQRGSSAVLLNPLLSPLGSFGGPTQTMALLPGSVAIDNGASFPVLDSNNNNITATDQRGVARPQGPAPDIGAFESQNLPVGTSTQLAFDQQPGNSLAGSPITPAIVVYILDSNGNLATTDNSMVALAVASGPTGAIAGGTAAVQAINGVATFTGLLVLTTVPGTVTLQATDGTLGAATSASFVVSLPTTVLSTSTTAAANSRYTIGGSVPIAVTFSAAVNVAGTPQLTLNDGAVVNYASGSGTPALTFSYTVAAGQNTADLDYASTTALALNGGSVQDLAGNAVVLTLPATGVDGLATKNLVIDTTAPTVSAVSTTAAANSHYKVGGTVSIKITFSKTVNVSGTPQLTLNDGAVVSYASGTGSSTLTFTYTVAAGQNTADLDYASTTALALNGGTIEDAAGNTAVLTLPATGSDGLANRKIVIDTTAPTVTGVSTTQATGAYPAGTVIPITVAFSEPVTVTGTPQLALDAGGGASASYSSGSGGSTLTFTYTVGAGQNSSDLDYSSINALTGSIEDAAGNAAVLTLPVPASGSDGLATQNIVIDTTPPSVSIMQEPKTLTNSTLATFAFTGADNLTPTANLVFLVSLDGGAFAPATSPVNYSDLASSGHTFKVESEDQAGNISPPAFCTWTIDTTPPSVSITEEPKALTNNTSATFAFTGADNLTPTASLVFLVSLDGGTFAPATSPVNYSDLASSGHTFQVESEDQAGNFSTPVSYAWTIDATPPTVAGVSSAKPSGAYAAGTAIPISIAFSEAVTVTGAPQLALNAGSSVAAVYSGGSGGSTLTFTYTVAAGQNTSELDYVGINALTLGSGSIEDAAGNAAVLTLPVPASGSDGLATQNIVIDTTPPSVSIMQEPKTLTNSTLATFAFTGADNLTPTANLVFLVSLDGGAFAPATSPVNYSDLASSGHTFKVESEDQAGNISPPAFCTWTIDTTPPSVSITEEPKASPTTPRPRSPSPAPTT